MAGCGDDCVNCVDTTPPAVPTNVYSVTGDGRVTVFWSYLEYPEDRDLVAYLVWRDDDADGAFDFLGEVPVDRPFDDFTYRFVDEDVVNGHDYEYAVSAVDAAGNESKLSFETVIDTPRPEGFDIRLFDFGTDPGSSGFDFSVEAAAPVPGAGIVDPTPPTSADLVVMFESGIPYVYSARPANVLLQDFGTIALEWVDWAPADGYSASGKAELIIGHSYIVEIRESPSVVNYAKFQVTSILPSSVFIDWAYQAVVGLPELKAPVDDGRLAGTTDLIRF